MGCKACERRRKALQALKDKKAAKGKQVQAAALGAVLAVSEAVGKAIGVGDGASGDSEAQAQSDSSAGE